MNAPQTTTPLPRRRSIWRWIALGLGLSVLIVALAVVNFLTLSRDAAALRQELFTSLNTSASPKVQINVGPGLMTLARVVVGMIDEVPPEARQALRAVRSASVGVYSLRQPVEASRRPGMILAADALMNRRHWSRVVGVADRDDTVLIYMPEKSPRFGPERICVAVCDGDQIVIVSAAVEPDLLVELLRDQPKLAAGLRL